MHEHVLSGLVRRRGELAGERDALKKRIEQIGIDLSGLDAVIRQFDPTTICPASARSGHAAPMWLDRARCPASSWIPFGTHLSR